MANNINNSPRGAHVAPGIYQREVDLSYASKSLGITKLGLVGETVKGPAFQVMTVENWREFQTMFGGTNPAKFRGSQYPKYELPYIAKEYLSESDNLQVVRVLGLSGVNAGPAWIISAYGTGKTYTQDNPMVVAVIRSRGMHKKSAIVQPVTAENRAAMAAEGICDDVYEYDGIEYFATNVEMVPSKTLSADNSCNPGFSATTGNFLINVNNYGTFTFKVTCTEKDANGNAIIKYYSVSLNPGDKNYIYNVLGGDPEVGDCEIYVEELYDVALKHLIETGELSTLGDGNLITYKNTRIIPRHADVKDLLTLDESMLTRHNVGERYLYSSAVSVEGPAYGKKAAIKVHVYKAANAAAEEDGETAEEGTISTLALDGGEDAVVNNGDTAEKDEIPGTEGDTMDKEDKDGTAGSTVDNKEEKEDKNETEGGTVDNKEEKEDKNETPATEEYTWVEEEGKAGHIYTVQAHTCADGKRRYWYVEDGSNPEVLGDPTKDSSYKKDAGTETYNNYGPNTNQPIFEEAVKVAADGLFYILNGNDVQAVTLDLNDYKEPYRYASTPWVVSEIKGSAEHVELTKLFRFHMISDGENSNTLCKVSIQNIRPEEGTFDVVVRDFNDIDSSLAPLEKYSQCNLIPGDKHYLGLMIGTIDESYEIKSNYITVEINESDKVSSSIPAGFLGYPLRDYESGLAVAGSSRKPQKPEFQYNLSVDDDIKPMKQYFGVSDRTGIDIDILKYKGVDAYTGEPESLSPCFHLDSRIFNGIPDASGVVTEGEGEKAVSQTVSVDGIVGYRWATVAKENMTAAGKEPRIGSVSDMNDTIYEDVRFRKFTMAFYGGWDGWDYYRTSRSIGDEFQYNTYKGEVNFRSGYGASLDILQDAEERGLEAGQRALTSDFYAFLAGARQFDNPKTVDINLFATPGIDYVNNNALVGEVIEMIEEDRQDSVYIVTTPDKPFGASDSEFDMFTADDAVWNLEDSEIDSNYVASYYPWIKFYDKENSQYIFLPPTKDVLRNMAHTDNVAYPWFAAAGWNRGTINGVKPRKNLKLAEQDALYAGRLNYVNTFAQEGMKIWGDKNFQIKDSVMNRLSKRRLLLRIRKLCNTAAIGLLFDPNDNTTKKSFISAITPVMDGILSNRGISDWRLEIDDSAEARDRLELPAKIFLKPIGALEYITMDFIITNQSTNWDNI